MSIETRSNSALFKRAEQLKRWEESDTNREPSSPKNKSRRVKFSSGCVFLAACAAGDKEEVKKLLEKGADINTANVDGLTALHQACIDDNLDMVEFLVDQGADVNRGDNEGWTPLHATASCGFQYIAKYLIEKGANVAAVNNDGELAIDIAECQKMEDLLRVEIDKRGIDCDAARNDEEMAMLRDAKDWLATKSSSVNTPHPKNGATALHVASAKGYLDVIKILLQCGADIDSQDDDGWTALHAAAHWGQKEACQLLVENLADLEAKNYVGQTPFDLSDSDMLDYLDELKRKQNKEDVNKRKAKKRVEIQDKTIEPESKVKKVEVEIKSSPTEEQKSNDNVEMEVSGDSSSDSDDTDSSSETESNSTDDEKKNRANSLTINSDKAPPPAIVKEVEVKLPPPVPPKQIVVDSGEEITPWRKTVTKTNKPEISSPVKSTASFREYKNNASDLTNDNNVPLKRTNSFQSDEEFYSRYKALHARIKACKESAVIPYNNSTNHQPPRPKSDFILTTTTTAANASAQQHYRSSKEDKNEISNSTVSTNTTSSPTKTTSPVSSPQLVSQPPRSGLKLALNKTPPSTNGSKSVATPTTNSSTPTTPTTPGGTRLQMFKNFFKSFVPPVRDEESETQRKAHAKRVRETRRSTQGVTLEEIKSAEQFVKMKNQPGSNNNNESPGANGDTSNNGITVSATITTAVPTVVTPVSKQENNGDETSATIHERRPSWRLKVDGGSKFKLEDATKPESPSMPNTPSFIRRTNTTTAGVQRPSSAPVETAETTITLPLRRPKTVEEKEQDKENDVRNAQATLATQAAIQRRRRPKRRSTGVVSFDNVDDLDQEKDPAAGGDSHDTAKLNSIESGSDRSSRSRISSTADIRNENGEIDYKKLYEQQLAENDRLKDKLRKSDEELRETKQTLEKINVVTSKNSLSELEKRERRAMERKLSEMEEELKQLQKLKAENERLKADNRSLTRVINKLTNSPKK